MKKILKQFTALLMVFTMLFCTVPVQAATVYTDIPTTIKIVNYRKPLENYHYMGMVSGTRKVKMKSSNPAVVGVASENLHSGKALYAVAKRPGSAYIYTKVGKRSYKTKVFVTKYTNPLKSVKLNNVNISGKKFNKNNICTLPYKKFANGTYKINGRVKKGWRVSYVSYFEKGWKRAEIIDNCDKLTIKGGKGFEAWLHLVNFKTGNREVIKLIFK